MHELNDFYFCKTYELPFGFKTSNIELKELFKAWFVISLAFTFAFYGLNISPSMLSFLLISAFTVGFGFVLHEFSHKIVAQHYGAFAEFRADNQMLALAIIMSVFGFLFAAPGAVFIMGRVTRKQNGMISLAGPLSNFLLALVFLFFNLFFPSLLFFYGFKINSWLALFNMLPFGNLDGSKVLNWNKRIYVFFIILFLITVFL